MGNPEKVTPITAAAKKIVGDMSEIESVTSDVEYAEIPGFVDGQTLCIGSVSAGDWIEWGEAKTEEQKRTAGLRLICRSLVGPAPEYRRYALNEKNVEIFRRFSHKNTENILKAILKLNGVKTKEERDQDALKNA